MRGTCARGQAGSRGKFKTNMADVADSQKVELIEFFRPFKNEVNLYVTNISRRLEKEMVQVRFGWTTKMPMPSVGN